MRFVATLMTSLLFAALSFAQSTFTGNGSLQAKATIPIASTSQTVNIGLLLKDTNDNGNTNLIEFLPILKPPASSTVGSLHASWGNVSSNTWGLALYTNSSGSPGTLLCSSIVTSTPSAGFNALSPGGCGTLTASTVYWIGQITGSATLKNDTARDGGIYCGASGLGAMQDSIAQGSTTFPASGATGTPIAYGGCPIMYATLNCIGACGASLEYHQASPRQGSSVTTLAYTVTVLTGDHNPVAVVGVEADGNTGSHGMTCTFGGNSMTQLVAPIAGSGGTIFGSVFILSGPPTGSQSVSCTSSFSGSDWQITTFIFSGINQTGTVGNTWRSTPDTATDGGGGGPVSVTLAAAHSATNDIVFNWIAFDVAPITGNGPAGKTGVTETFNPSFNSVQVGVQITAGTGASITMSWPYSSSSAGTWATMAFALIPG